MKRQFVQKTDKETRTAEALNTEEEEEEDTPSSMSQHFPLQFTENGSSEESPTSKIENNTILKQELEKWNRMNEIQKKLNEQIKKCRMAKEELNTRICSYLVENQLDKQRIQTNFGNFTIHEKKEYSTITYSILTDVLKEIMEMEEVNRIIELVKSKRQIKSKKEIASLT